MEEEWLNIFCTLASCIAITDMTDSHFTRKIFQSLLTEHLSYESITLHAMEYAFIINSRYTATLLSSVLKSMQAVISEACSILYTVDSKHTTLVMQLVIHYFLTITHTIHL